MATVVWKIHSPERYKYDLVEFDLHSIRHIDPAGQNAPYRRPKKKKIKFSLLDCAFVHYLISELHSSAFYRRCVVQTTTVRGGPHLLILTPTKRDLIDYHWNERLCHLVRERCEIDHAFSWLSTLGGAFSALGDYFEKCADTAGRISIHQWQLAFRIGDPSLQARCRLYLSLSLIQKKKFKLAARIVREEYHLTKSRTVIDERLLNMCRGIWAKLQYEHSLYRNKVDIKR